MTAVEQLYRSHGDLVLRRARQILADEGEAREALQEIFMSLVQKPSQLDGKRSLTAWLYARFDPSVAGLQFETRLESGEATFLNNLTVLHARSEFDDWDEPGKKLDQRLCPRCADQHPGIGNAIPERCRSQQHLLFCARRQARPDIDR